MTPADRAIVTLAVGNPVFVRFAVNLARSFLWWHRDGDIRFAIATDHPELLPADVQKAVEVISLAPGQYGTGFTAKLWLDQFAPARHTIFLDADCLIVGPLTGVFDSLAGRPVAVIGGSISEGEWFGDVRQARSQLGVGAIPKFNGGLYYIERGKTASAVYATARELEPRYDALGLVRLRGKPNEELLMALALGSHGIEGVPEDGTIMAEPLNFATGLSLDVLRGTATLRNEQGHPRYQEKWPLRVAHPLVVHFLGYHTDRHPYTTEARRLELVASGVSWRVAWWRALLTHALPARIARSARDLMRPIYHAAFGPRAVAPSNRG